MEEVKSMPDSATGRSNSITSKFGPALLVTAAFIGPGTVLTASKAGANYGFSLLWAILFAVVATIVLQEMAARLGIISGGGLAKAIKDTISSPIGRILALTLVLGAILVGNAAYQTGNLLGAATGLNELINFGDTGFGQSGDESQPTDGFVLTSAAKGAILFGVIALVIIWIGRLSLLQALMAGLVALMSLLFLASAIASKPNVGSLVAGFVPSLSGRQYTEMESKDDYRNESVTELENRRKKLDPENDSDKNDIARIDKLIDLKSGIPLFIIGLIGTTVVPYNLFLHASSASEKWHSKENDDAANQSVLSASRRDTIVSVIIGGFITAAILITMAVAFEKSDAPLTQATQVGEQMNEALGNWAGMLFGIGLCAAGLSSAITAPIAAAYATAGCFQWPCKLSDVRLKTVATLVVIFGVGLAVSLGQSPLQVIILAQVANGLLLPLVACFLLFVLNQPSLMGKFKNGLMVNVFGIVVILITLALAFRQFQSVYSKLFG